jgi:hypothetical protein
MTNRDDEDKTLGTLGAYAIGGPALAGAYVLGGILQEAPRDRDLGPAPIGSDPWLLREVEGAIAKDNPAHVKLVNVTVLEAVVTLRCVGTAEQAGLIERAARTVQGIKKLVVNVEPQTP